MINAALPNPFVSDQPRFKLDEDTFVAAIEEAPSFISNPRPEYLTAVEILPILKVLAGG